MDQDPAEPFDQAIDVNAQTRGQVIAELVGKRPSQSTSEGLGSQLQRSASMGTTWPSLRKAFTRHGLGMPARNPEAVRQRAIAAASQRVARRPRRRSIRCS